MSECENCRYALWDYEEYYGTTHKDWFVSGCRKGIELREDCEYYTEKTNVNITNNGTLTINM